MPPTKSATINSGAESDNIYLYLYISTNQLITQKRNAPNPRIPALLRHKLFCRGKRDYIHVEDLADIHVLAMKHLLAGGNSEIFSCVTDIGQVFAKVIDTVRKVSAVNFEVTETHRGLGDIARLVADSTKIRNVLKWLPRRDNPEAICRTAHLFETSKTVS